MRKALIFQGGWDGHEPKLTSKRFGGLLEEEGFSVTISDTLECFNELEPLLENDLIVACWTMGETDFTGEQMSNLSKAIGAGVGLAGCHGGMCDSFRNNTEWQFITGGNWVSHPGGDGTEYVVNITCKSNPIVAGLDDFNVASEHYYLHVDPAVEVLATTRFPIVAYYNISNRPVDMPVVWTKYWGNGRIFYTSLGHLDNVFDKFPNAQIIMKRGMLWAADGRVYARENNLTTDRFENTAKMY